MNKRISLAISEKKQIQTTTFFFKNENEAIRHLNRLTKSSLCLFDEKFKNKALVKKFPLRMSLQSGEKLKSLESFSKLMPKIHEKVENISKSELCFVAIGGGSLGDFVSFVASIYKRGCPTIQIPTTWLSAVDSAHGGKSALNLKSKNQIGTIHYPTEVLVIPEYLQGQPNDLMIIALGEVLKYAFLERDILKRLRNIEIKSSADLFSVIPLCVQVKNRFLKKDPFEKTGDRFFLNLGHTIGHGFEAEYQMPHGLAVLLGLEFMLRWSVHRKYIKVEEAKKLIPLPIMKIVQQFLDHQGISYGQMIKNRRFTKHLASDKKISKNRLVREIFVFQQKCQIIDVSLQSYEIERNRQVQEGEHGSLLF